eukprot:13719713-Alexandrium_andersonii.AAC.1
MRHGSAASRPRRPPQSLPRWQLAGRLHPAAWQRQRCRRAQPLAQGEGHQVRWRAEEGREG